MSTELEKRGIKIEFNADDALRDQEQWNRAQDKTIKKNEELRNSAVEASKGISQQNAAMKQGAVQAGALASRTGTLTKEQTDLAKKFRAAGVSVKELADTFSVSEKKIRDVLGLQKEQAEIEKQAEKQRIRLTAQEQLAIRTLEARTRAAVQLSKERVARIRKETAALKLRNNERARRLAPTVLAPEITTTFTAPPTQEQIDLMNATDRTTESIGRQAAGVTRLAKKMVLWAIGARTVFTVYNRLRRVIVAAVKDVFENTEEAERLSDAWINLQRSLVLSLLPFDRTRELLVEIAEQMDEAAGTALDFSEAFEGASAAGAIAMAKLAERTGVSSQAAGNAISALSGILGPTGMAMIGVAAEAGLLGAELQGVASDTSDMVKAQREAENEAGLLAAAMDKQADSAEKLRDNLFRITEQALERRLQAQREFGEELTDLVAGTQDEINELIEQRIERTERVELTGGRRLEAIARQVQDRRAAIDRQLNRKLQDIELQAQEQSQRNALRHRQRLLDIERRFRDKMRDIERNFGDSIEDAIAKRDATAALKAIRTRSRGIEDAQRERSEARSDANTDFGQQNSEQANRLEQQRQAAKRAHARQLEDLKIAREQQERELRISLEQQLEDLEDNLQDQEDDLGESFREQFDETRQHFEDVRRENRLQNAIDRALALNTFVNRENAYRAHLNRLRLIRAQFPEVAGASANPTGPGFAQGGQFIASGKTPFVAGEGPTPEAVTITPLGSGVSNRVNHSISGSVTHDIDVAISRSIDGMEGRINAVVDGAINRLLGG